MKLRAGIDVGGTFTDLVAVDVQSGERFIFKVPSTPQAPERAVIAALRELLSQFETPPAFEYLAHSTTIATNALLGQLNLELPRIAFVTTAGFRDVIEIGRQNRSEIYNLLVSRPKPLVARNDRIGVRERIDFQGNVLTALDENETQRVVSEVRARGVESVAIGLLHSYVNDAHERQLERALAAALPDLSITRSSSIDPEYREYERFSTAVVNAVLSPIVRTYIRNLLEDLRELRIVAPLYVMQSNGGLVSADRVFDRPAAIIESGPASGVVGAAELAAQNALTRVLSFDMGGTTAKAGTILDGTVQVAAEFEAAGTTHSGRQVKGSGYPVRFPFVDLAEVSAGGGTIAWIDEAGALRVGPISAGSDPGPACYGRSERATVTDANVVLGRLGASSLLGGNFPIDAARSRSAIAQLAQPLGLSIEETAAGIIRIVDAQMAKVLRIVTVERGVDPRDFALAAFGGNGPLHACALADELRMQRIVVPAKPGVFSAFGLLAAPVQAVYVRSILTPTARADGETLERLFAALESDARQTLVAQGVRENEIVLSRRFDARYGGQSFELEIAANAVPAAAAAFHEAHEQRYGYRVPEEAVELVNARLVAGGRIGSAPPAFQNSAREAGATTRQVWIEGSFAMVPVYQRGSLTHAARVEAPAIVEQYDSCIFVAPSWCGRIAQENFVMEKLHG